MCRISRSTRSGVSLFGVPFWRPPPVPRAALPRPRWSEIRQTVRVAFISYESVRELAKEGNLEYLSDRVLERYEEESEEES
jgi:hypothetical protein